MWSGKEGVGMDIGSRKLLESPRAASSNLTTPTLFLPIVFFLFSITWALIVSVHWLDSPAINLAAEECCHESLGHNPHCQKKYFTRYNVHLWPGIQPRGGGKNMQYRVTTSTLVVCVLWRSCGSGERKLRKRELSGPTSIFHQSATEWAHGQIY